MERSIVQPPVIASVVVQHVEDAAALRSGRSIVVRAPNIDLLHLGRYDERLEAALDGIAAAGEAGVRMSFEALERLGVGEVFVAAFCAVRIGDPSALDRLVGIAEGSAAARTAVSSLLGWLPPQRVRGLIVAWLNRSASTPRQIAIAACAMHRVDPGAALVSAINAHEASLAQRALQAVGELGRADLLEHCIARMEDNDPITSFQAARAAVLLGDRKRALSKLHADAVRGGAGQRSAVALATLSGPISRSRELVRQLGVAGAPVRLIIAAAALTGDAAVVPWLIRLMADRSLARAAGEALSVITGLDIAATRLNCDQAPVDGGPSENPHDDDVAVEEDENLPWPSEHKVSSWWRENGRKFNPGQQSFLGSAPSLEHLSKVLRTGTQRQRAIAATMNVLICPGKPSFNVAAPAKRQTALLSLVSGI